ncbi:DUF72 domain-containing protein [Vibrio sonorensis]|uniref:DUF72 domain-containing protein n=1 Tax=Vibrio sonorensis TaxID=1004316 RepID=UPI0008D96F01|nr:DUF72 domain-containing protein [Vibrio sonorensis]
MTQPPLLLGLTMWSHNQWQKSFYGSGTQNNERLARYAEVFHTVEGNTTFYATPSAATVSNWKDATHDEFRFTFKLPKVITHQHLLANSTAELNSFLRVMEPLHSRVGQWTIQLPAAFGEEHLDRLFQFCRLFPRDFPLGVEVRNMAFFSKGEAERRLNHELMEAGIDRIVMDSRPVFSAPPDSEAVIDAHQKKPKVPVHAIATAQHPMIRFIGHPEMAENLTFFKPWLSKIPAWIEEGRQPYLMIHTPDNAEAPQLAKKLYETLSASLDLPELAPFPSISGNQQIQMF